MMLSPPVPFVLWLLLLLINSIINVDASVSSLSFCNALFAFRKNVMDSKIF